MKYSEVRAQIKSQSVSRKVPKFKPANDPLAWAKALKARHEAGEVLSKLQISMYREALRLKEE